MSENRLKLLELIDLLTLHQIMTPPPPKKIKKRKGKKMNSVIKTYKMSKFCIYVLKHMWESFIGHCLVPYKNHKKLQASKNDHESVNSCVYYTKNFGTQRNKYPKN